MVTRFVLALLPVISSARLWEQILIDDFTTRTSKIRTDISVDIGIPEGLLLEDDPFDYIDFVLLQNTTVNTTSDTLESSPNITEYSDLFSSSAPSTSPDPDEDRHTDIGITQPTTNETTSSQADLPIPIVSYAPTGLTYHPSLSPSSSPYPTSSLAPTETGMTNQTEAGGTNHTEAGATNQTEAGATNQTEAGATNQTEAGATNQTQSAMPSGSPTLSPTALSSTSPSYDDAHSWANIRGNGGCGQDEVLYRVTMKDSFGNGWEGTTIKIVRDDDVWGHVFYGFLTDGKKGEHFQCLRPDRCYNVKVENGFWQEEVTWDISVVSLGYDPATYTNPPVAWGGAPANCMFSLPWREEVCKTTCKFYPGETTSGPTVSASLSPTMAPTIKPATVFSTIAPTVKTTTQVMTSSPTESSTLHPTSSPTSDPTAQPTGVPSKRITSAPTRRRQSAFAKTRIHHFRGAVEEKEEVPVVVYVEENEEIPPVGRTRNVFTRNNS